jgi:hypothetical protein
MSDVLGGDEFDLSDMAGTPPIVPDQKPWERIDAWEKRSLQGRRHRAAVLVRDEGQGFKGHRR